jgi:hypothetical protein
MQSVLNYVMNKSDKTTFDLAYSYEAEGQLAAAIGYYLETIDLTNNYLLTYECMLRAALCFERQEGRIGTTLNMLYKAISIDPTRGEVVFHLVRILNNLKRYYEAYALASAFLTRYSLQNNSLQLDCDYEGEYAIVFEKGVSAWWIGEFEESRAIMYDIYKKNYSIRYTRLAENNLNIIGHAHAYRHTPDKILKKPFKDSNTITSSSQSMQDIFVLTILEGKRNGTYLELGSAHPSRKNNTYLLETKYGWKGVSIENNIYDVSRFRLERSNSCWFTNALNVDYVKLKEEFPETIDYLQVDLDPANISYIALENIIKSGMKFNVITFEHDFYRESSDWKEKSRQLLNAEYVLTVPDVCCMKGKSFEDWWVHKSIYKEHMQGEAYKTPDKYFY